MRYGEFLVDYIAWHYGRSIQDFLNVWSNYVWFLYNFFSIPILLRTLIAPWRRMDEHKKAGFHLEVFMERVVVNFITRIIGVFLRLFIIISGMIAIFLTLFFGFVAFIAWITLPLTLIGLVSGAMVVLAI